jgi:N-acetylmuramoyl-L-alanine amidase
MPFKGMKVCFPTKTTTSTLLSAAALVLTMFFGFSTPVAAQQPYKIRKVVIDPGHGGKDPGCSGHHSKEKEIALSIGLELGKKIKAAFPEIQVIYTRETDIFVPLNERAAIANRNKADLFISVHCNYIGVRNRATGTETYVLGLHRAEDNLDVAKRENSAILLEDNYEKTYEGFDPNSPEGHIILTMFQNVHFEQSIMFATNVEQMFKKMSKLPSRGVKQAGFLVLRETTMPGALIETGFLSTDLDEQYLMKKENQQEMASCIFIAFQQYKKEVEDPEHQAPVAIHTPARSDSVTEQHKGGQVSENQVAGTVYRIQIAASSKSSIDSRYHALDDLEVIRDGELYKFLVGSFPTQEAARTRLSALKSKGFDGAFIVAYKEGKRVKA